jgi:2-keto-4-pentenoate hydratase
MSVASMNELLGAAAHELVKRRRAGESGERFAETSRPADLLQALAMQTAAAELWCAQQNDAIGAWKAGMPALGDNGEWNKLVVAPIFARSIHTGSAVNVWPAEAKATGARVARIEPELAFVLARDLPPRERPYGAAEVKAAIGSVHLALELIHCRFQQPAACTFAEKLADCLENQGLLLGPAIDKAYALSARELSLTLVQQQETQSFRGKHPAGDPAAPLCWLAEFLRGRGQGLQAGQAVITGCYSDQVLEVALDQKLTLRYSSSDNLLPLGQIDVEFHARQHHD